MRAGPILYLQEVHLPRGAAAGARQRPPRAPESRSAPSPPTGTAANHGWPPREGHSSSLTFHLESLSVPISIGIGGCRRDDEQPAAEDGGGGGGGLVARSTAPRVAPR